MWRKFGRQKFLVIAFGQRDMRSSIRRIISPYFSMMVVTLVAICIDVQHIVWAVSPPTVVNETYATDEDTVLSVSEIEGVLINDSDPDGDSLSVVLEVGPEFGSVDVQLDGSFLYEPVENYAGDDAFSYSVSDGTSSVVGVTTIVVQAIDDPPSAVSDSYAVAVNQTLHVSAAVGVLANDIDVEGDALTADIVSLPSNGEVIFRYDGSFSYTPGLDYIGADTFTYQVISGYTFGTTAVVELIISPADSDSDGVENAFDNCPDVNNVEQSDSDHDGSGDVCDFCPEDVENDADGDGICESDDNCLAILNGSQSDVDYDGIGDACDRCMFDASNDEDEDTICDDVDNCLNMANENQEDFDRDNVGDMCDSCPNDVSNDEDQDAYCADVDNCPAVANESQLDTDQDQLGDDCDGDDDGDLIEDGLDNCPLDANPDQSDLNLNDIGDACDPDHDGDGISDAEDNCPDAVNESQANIDGDDLGDVCDSDADGDAVLAGKDCNDQDSMVWTALTWYRDEDGDGIGVFTEISMICSATAPDGFSGIYGDNCPTVANSDQSDIDDDGIGDACDDASDTPSPNMTPTPTEPSATLELSSPTPANPTETPEDEETETPSVAPTFSESPTPIEDETTQPDEEISSGEAGCGGCETGGVVHRPGFWIVIWILAMMAKFRKNVGSLGH